MNLSTNETYRALRPFEARGIHKGTTFKKPSQTQQSYADEADINNIVAKFSETGVMPTGDPANVPMFGDFSDRKLRSYLGASNFVADVRARFDSLPSAVRERVGNTPEGLIRFITNSENKDEAIKLGLLNPPAPAPQPEPVPESGTEGTGE